MTRPAPSRLQLFLGFFEIGIYGFGGVLPWARRMVVEQKRWLTAAEFTDMLSLCQFLPGPNVINLSVALGARFGGVSGAAVCFVGLMAAPMAIVIGLGALYAEFSSHPVVRHAFAGLSAAAGALVLATAFKIAAPLRHRPVAVVMAVLVFLAIAWLRLSLPLVLLVLGSLSVFLAWRFRV